MEKIFHLDADDKLQIADDVKIIRKDDLEKFFAAEEIILESKKKAQEILDKAEEIYKNRFEQGLTEGKEEGKSEYTFKIMDMVLSQVDSLESLEKQLVEVVTKSVNKITVESPTIQHDSYLSSYITALDLCLQGVLSPSTLGIDTKKLDNAEAQREKEKTTLYTRQTIIELLNNALPKLVKAALQADSLVHNSNIDYSDIEISVKFGEYANPSFESQVETVAKAKTAGLMSIEQIVEELYGDSKSNVWKEQEVKRIKEEQGIAFEDETSELDDIQPIGF